MWPCFRLPKEREEERHFLENGALLLEELITSFNGRSNPIRSFSKKELKRATNNYHQDGISHQHGPYNFYKGNFKDRAILVKKFTGHAPQNFIGECINEVAVASQISNHNNVLKLLGCCLETEIPILVYEFAASGRLSDYIYEKELSTSKKYPLLSWERKLKIVTEIADAIAYLHNGTSKPIIHRFINCGTIFLDQHHVAKLSEFGLSVSIPLGATHVDANVSTWPMEFIAPESERIGRFTAKSDVGSLGGVLLEILTGKLISDMIKEVCGARVLDQGESQFRWLNSEFLLAEDNEKNYRVYLEANLVKGNKEQLMACVGLAMRCVRRNPDERPSMMEAAKELRRIRSFQQDSL
ncbi:hypothetical protein HHK36_022291 [Tetracentron sinense]|uniref:Protein kinase domain-containing protein n=1 Tax=Tetracentron sinense TaxID=13715 RepID=A0A835D6M5_TETSI|nr:hypothetical protein HHK36_022291 [Tetracentron sinense]